MIRKTNQGFAALAVGVGLGMLMRDVRQWMAGALSGAAVLCLSAQAQAQGPGFQVVSDGPALEIRFRGVPLKSVRADDNQSALSLDFNQPVDPAIFDALARQLPQWIGMAYTSYDNGVIRATRPVTFLTRQETDGFSLRLQPRTAAAPAPATMQPAPTVQQQPMTMAQGPVMAPYPGPPQPYPQQPYPPQPGLPPQPQGAPQPPIPFAPYETYVAARNYYGLRYAERRADPAWERAYTRAAMRSDSDAAFGTEIKSFKNNDRILTSRARVKVALGSGIALLGSITDVDSKAAVVRTPTGTFAADKRNVLTGSAGVSLEMGPDTEMTLEGLLGNGTTGGRIGLYGGDPDGFLSTTLVYHQPLLGAAEAIRNKGRRDELGLAGARRSNVSMIQGVNGGETSAGLSLTLGFGGAPRASQFSLW